MNDKNYAKFMATKKSSMNKHVRKSSISIINNKIAICTSSHTEKKIIIKTRVLVSQKGCTTDLMNEGVGRTSSGLDFQLEASFHLL